MKIDTVELHTEDMPSIVALEQACWPEKLQASAATLRQRLDGGHILLGALADSRLVAMAAWRHARFSPDDPASFPKNFDQFSTPPSIADHNAAFVYNLGVHPQVRGSNVVMVLIDAVLDKLRADPRCRYLVADGRCPSYNGSDDEAKPIRQSPAFRRAIDRSMSGGGFPDTGELTSDPVLRFYHRVLDCHFQWIIPDFIPSDVASGGFRVIYYKEFI